MENTSEVSVNISLQKVGTSLEAYDLSIKVLFAVLGIIFMVFASIAIVALNKTKQTPPTSRFLSSGLICYDILAVGCYTIRKFVEHHDINILIQVVGTGFCVLAYVTVGIMSFERLVIFYSPHFYLRHITPERVKKFVAIIWVVFSVMYYFIRLAVCYMNSDTFSMYNVVGSCNSASFLFYGTIIVLVVAVSLACYFKIFVIIKSEKPTTNKPESLSAVAKRLRAYKSTSLVFVYILTITVTSLAYVFIISLNLDTVPLRLANDVVNTFNCMMDPCMYVLWYRECRLEILKMIGVCTPSLTLHIEQMRMKVFDIVTVEKIHKIRSNAVHPLPPRRSLMQM